MSALDTKARFAAHEAFDQLWSRHGWSRESAYRWLALRLGIARERCHFSMFDAARCNQVIEIVRRELPNLKVKRSALRTGNNPRGRRGTRKGRRPPWPAPEIPAKRPRRLSDCSD